ncbi:MAG: serine/threonine-protein phosphatase [Anaerolineae bacterium]|nr:serine/threonine-protein phosphatase [Anaerolineae bacterium]
MLSLKSYGLTAKGSRNSFNQDFVYVDAASGLFIVADGMGGYSEGSWASELAIETFVTSFAANGATSQPVVSRLREAFAVANLAVWNAGHVRPGGRGMGTTFSALVVSDTEAHLIHVGDTRIYRLRGATLQQLTTDHTIVAEWLWSGSETPPDRAHLPFSHMLSRSLGTQDFVAPQLEPVDAAPGDLFLLASDGFTQALPDESLAALLLGEAAGGVSSPDVSSLCQRMFAAAAATLPQDDMTLALVEVAEFV